MKVLDFGLAKAMSRPALRQWYDAVTDETVARDDAGGDDFGHGGVYMSPEQARGKPVDQRADIWAFGCVLDEMLTSSSALYARPSPIPSPPSSAPNQSGSRCRPIRRAASDVC